MPTHALETEMPKPAAQSMRPSAQACSSLALLVSEDVRHWCVLVAFTQLSGLWRSHRATYFDMAVHVRTVSPMKLSVQFSMYAIPSFGRPEEDAVCTDRHRA